MAYLWVIAIGFILCLGIIGSIFFFSIRSSVNIQDATRIDMKDTSDHEN